MLRMVQSRPHSLWNATCTSSMLMQFNRSMSGAPGGNSVNMDPLNKPDNYDINASMPTTTHFGYQSVPLERKEQLVGEVFAKVADKYDLMNDLMSAGVHRLWKRHFIDVLSPGADTKLLDVAGGTGDIAFRFIEAARQASQVDSDVPYSAKVTVADINPSMLRVGQQRADQLGYQSYGEMEWVCANAESLPFPDDQFDAYTIAFGIRNCTHIDRVLREAYRVLKPGGRFLCLEFSHITSEQQHYLPFIKELYEAFSFHVIPEIGHLIANDRDSYRYLVESIRKFPPQPVFAKMISEAGFRQVQWENLTFGVTAIHSGWKLPDEPQ